MNGSHTCHQKKKPMMTMVVACNDGKRHSVAIVNLLRAILEEDGLVVDIRHLHLCGWIGGWSVACSCNICRGEKHDSGGPLEAWNEAKAHVRQVFSTLAD